MLYCGGNRFKDFKHADMKGVKLRIKSAASLDDGNYEAKIPVVKGNTWRNNGSSTRNAYRFEHDIRILNGEY